MKPASLDIPNHNDDLADWLTGHLLSRHLAELVAELAAIHAGSPTETLSIDDVLGADREAVLTDGLGALPHSRLVQFLRQPKLLLDLQETVLAEGGAPWQLTDLVDDELQHRREAGWLRLRQEIDKQQWHTFTKRELPQPVVITEGGWSPASIGLAVAALALVGTLVWLFGFATWNEPVEGEAWGWNRPAVFAEQNPQQDYLSQLANAANEWFNKRPLTRAHLSARMLQFRQGCAVLLFREHNQLPPEDQEWLKTECRDWAKSLDQHLANLEDGADVVEVRQAVDDLTKSIVAALHIRASK